MLAQHLGPLYHNVLSFWFPVHDPEAASVSPGRLLLWHMLQHGPDNGIELIDYGAGDAPYKVKFGNTAIRSGRAHWFSRGFWSGVAHLQQGLEWRLKAVNRKLGIQG